MYIFLHYDIIIATRKGTHKGEKTFSNGKKYTACLECVCACVTE